MGAVPGLSLTPDDSLNPTVEGINSRPDFRGTPAITGDLLDIGATDGPLENREKLFGQKDDSLPIIQSLARHKKQ